MMELSSESPFLAHHCFHFWLSSFLFTPMMLAEECLGSHTGADLLQPMGTNKAMRTIHYNQILICSLEGNLFKRWLISSFDSILSEINLLVLHSNKKTSWFSSKKPSFCWFAAFYYRSSLCLSGLHFLQNSIMSLPLWPAEMEASFSPTLILLSRLAMSFSSISHEDPFLRFLLSFTDNFYLCPYIS